MTPDVIFYYAFMAAYLVGFVVIVATLRSIARALNRIADKIDGPSERSSL